MVGCSFLLVHLFPSVPVLNVYGVTVNETVMEIQITSTAPACAYIQRLQHPLRPVSNSSKMYSELFGDHQHVAQTITGALRTYIWIAGGGERSVGSMVGCTFVRSGISRTDHSNGYIISFIVSPTFMAPRDSEERNQISLGQVSLTVGSHD